jgi:putative nucleotidyltransferase with HDIG domain
LLDENGRRVGQRRAGICNPAGRRPDLVKDGFVWYKLMRGDMIKMRIPSRQTCLELICEYEMLEHIVAHSLQVCRVALYLVDRLSEQGITLDRKMVEAAALLHDITKTRSFQTGEMHTETGAALLRERGYFEVGEIVRQHVRLDSYFQAEIPDEAEIVNYADKRVLHDKIVPMSDRMDYILEKYGQRADLGNRLEWLWEKSEEVERRIFSSLPFGPEALCENATPGDMETGMAEVRAILDRLATRSNASR